MSQKQTKTKPAAKKEPKAARAAVKKPSGHVPTAMVSSRRGREMVLRAGKGFSMGEVKGAGVPFPQAVKWGLPVDRRRRSVLEDNVGSVKNWVTHAKTSESPESEVKKIEEEIVKVEKELKKEVVKVKKEVKKVGKEVVEKVEKPLRSRGRKKKTPSKKAA